MTLKVNYRILANKCKKLEQTVGDSGDCDMLEVLCIDGHAVFPVAQITMR